MGTRRPINKTLAARGPAKYVDYIAQMKGSEISTESLRTLNRYLEAFKAQSPTLDHKDLLQGMTHAWKKHITNSWLRDHKPMDKVENFQRSGSTNMSNGFRLHIESNEPAYVSELG